MIDDLRQALLSLGLIPTNPSITGRTAPCRSTEQMDSEFPSLAIKRHIIKVSSDRTIQTPVVKTSQLSFGSALGLRTGGQSPQLDRLEVSQAALDLAAFLEGVFQIASVSRPRQNSPHMLLDGR